MPNPKTQDFADTSWVQVPTDGSGKRVGHVQVDELQADGTSYTVYFPAFVIADAKGRVANVVDGELQVAAPDLLEALTALTLEIQQLREELSLSLA